MTGQALLSICRNELSYALSKFREGLSLEQTIELLTRNLKGVNVSEGVIATYVEILKERAK